MGAKSTQVDLPALPKNSSSRSLFTRQKRGEHRQKLPMVAVHPCPLDVSNPQKGKYRRHLHRARMHHKQEASNLTRLLDASSPRYCFTGPHKPPANSPEVSGRDAIPSYRVAVAEARTCELETGIEGSLRWSGSCFPKRPIHGIIERRPQS